MGGEHTLAGYPGREARRKRAQDKPLWPTSPSFDQSELGEKLGHLFLRVEVVRTLAAHLVSEIAVPIVSVR